MKFFIVGSAAFCILLAHGISNAWGIGRGALTMPRELAGRPIASWAWSIVVLGLCAAIAAQTFLALRNYYFDPAYARDDYRGIARRILRMQRADDAVLLDSANQWEVFTYYYPDGPHVYPLPKQRPLDQAAVETDLAEIAAQHPRLFVLYWGDGEADPQRVIESWLDAHTYKATEQWVNSIRFLTYAVPARLSDKAEVKRGARFGEHITLDGFTLSTPQVQPGDILQLDLFWRADAPLGERYRVFVHVPDQKGQIVAHVSEYSLKHSLLLQGLRPDTLYHLRARSSDPSGNLGRSGDLTFRTLKTPSGQDLVPPVISAIQLTGVTNTRAVIIWVTELEVSCTFAERESAFLATLWIEAAISSMEVSVASDAWDVVNAPSRTWREPTAICSERPRCGSRSGGCSK